MLRIIFMIYQKLKHLKNKIINTNLIEVQLALLMLKFTVEFTNNHC